MGVGGLEPPTSALSELRSNQLIYTPEGFRDRARAGILASGGLPVQWGNG